MRYKMAQDSLQQATEDFQKAKTTALADWKQDVADHLTTDPFWQWATTNAPMYSQALAAMNGASAACAAAAAAIQGNEAFLVGQYQNAMASALGGNSIPG